MATNRTDEINGMEAELEISDQGMWDDLDVTVTLSEDQQRESGNSVPAIPEILPDHKGVSFAQLGGVTPTCYLYGPAGSGKTYNLRQANLADPDYCLMTATTGIAAVNLGLGVRTIHSTLKFGRTDEAVINYIEGTLHRALRDVKKGGYRWLVIDEVSMLHRKVMEHIFRALQEVNMDQPDESPLGLMLTGDFAQLPPIPEQLMENGKPKMKKWGEKMIPVTEPTPWCFESDEWRDHFDGASHQVGLTKIWRQSDPTFLDALKAIRRGVGSVGAGALKESGAHYIDRLDLNFDGTTIMSKNDAVDRFNQNALRALPGPTQIAVSERWTAKRNDRNEENFPGEWTNIPRDFTLKVDALVMILNNDTECWSYVNGDTGHIREIKNGADGTVSSVVVELIRTGSRVEIGKVTRKIEQRSEPEKEEKERDSRVRREKVYNRQMWILGECTYLPVRLAYATTVHKSQGLTLDKVQIDPSDWMFSKPGMCYVAVSRCRTPNGLYIVGGVNEFAKKIKADPVLQKRGFL